MLGDVFSSAVSWFNAEQNRDAAAHAQNQSEAFSERMSNTTYQRMIDDLTKAGLSPMLAYNKTGSAPTGSATTGTSSIEAPKLGETSVRSAQAKLAQEQAEVAKSTAIVNAASADKLRAETMNINQDTENKRLYPGFNEAQIKELLERAGQHGSSSRQLETLVDSIKQDINLKKPAEEFKKDHPTFSKYLSPVQDSLRTIFEGLGLLRGSSAMPFVTKNAPRGK